MISTQDATGKPLQQDFSISDKISFLHGQLNAGRNLLLLHRMLVDSDGSPFCPCRSDSCLGAGKHPAELWSHRLFRPDSAQARVAIANYTEQQPDRGWGVHCGLSNIVTLDIDPKNGGNNSLAELERDLGIDLGEPHVWTGSGGRHFYFSAWPGIDPRRGFVGSNGVSRCAILLRPGLEIFAGQHFMVLPYSPHASGKWYKVGTSATPPPIPESIKALVLGAPAFTANPRPAPRAPRGIGADVTHGARGSVEAARAYLDTFAPPVCGSGQCEQHTAYVAALLMVDFALTQSEALPLLRQATDNGHGWTDATLIRKLDWAANKPGERGTKGQGGRSRLTPEEQAFVEDKSVEIDLKWCHAYLNVTTGEVVHVPRHDPNAEPDFSDVADGVAVPEPTPEPCKQVDVTTASEPACNCFFSVLMHNPESCNGRIMRLPARRWSCPACGPRRRRHYKATITHHLDQFARQPHDSPEPVLFAAWVPRELWKRLGGRLRAKRANFFRLDPHATVDIEGERFFVVATVPANGVDWQPITVDAAKRRLCDFVDGFPSTLKVRVWWSSRRWKLLPEPKKEPQGYKRVGRIAGSIAQQRAILEAHQCERKTIHYPGTFWGWRADQFRYREDDWSDILMDLKEGAVISTISVADIFGNSDRRTNGLTPEQIFLSS